MKCSLRVFRDRLLQNKIDMLAFGAQTRKRVSLGPINSAPIGYRRFARTFTSLFRRIDIFGLFSVRSTLKPLRRGTKYRQSERSRVPARGREIVDLARKTTTPEEFRHNVREFVDLAAGRSFADLDNITNRIGKRP